jgi:ABC-type enterobactin transport system permease subunit
MEQSRAWFFAVFYAGIAALALLDLIVRRRLCPRPFLAVGLGTAAGVCSVVGMFSLSACVGAPAVTVFTTSSITGILGTAVMDTALFGEERSPAWWATLVFGVLCILASAGVLPLL